MKIFGIAFGMAIAVLFIAVIIAFTPMTLIWGLNFMGFNLPMDLWTWFGAFLIQLFIGISTIIGVNKK